MILKPVASEKAVKLIESENTLVFSVGRKFRKTEIKKEIESLFNVKVGSMNTLIRKNKKIVYVKLNKENPAIDIATKLGML